ncbi:Crp/Fnr family transcriptional regulator [Pseudoflavitalea sp. X16]|uniref:Crp/Fnr family transcriptional regulator n=1 Tax=Paraflavitalea devenefica TaxID=2716334 RepID=UPI001423F905|nr:Crp/Fnr family transcriptional regulator [Paraflavitalea devenefica]NII28473.1 Crp/Fnr family transcriptional regulator [Paraflavitalea devenefica]
MFEPLLKYINNYTSTTLSESESELIKSAFTLKKIKRKQYFLQAGDVCRYFGFILKGAMRQYLVDDKGVEHIVHLSIENWWVGDRESWVMLTPSNYYIDAWEDTELLLITRADTLKLVQQIPAFSELLRLLDERNNIATQRRIASSISYTAEKRYIDFINSHPDFLQRFPQHVIASYLGITKETLSRVRKQAMQK